MAHISLHQGTAFLVFCENEAARGFASSGIGEGDVKRVDKVEPATRVVLRNLPEECGEEEFRKTLERCGLVVACALLRDRERKAIDCGFAQFYKAKEAEKLIQLYNGKVIGKKRLEVCPVSEFDSSEKMIYISNFHPDTTEAQLYVLLSRYGEILNTSLKNRGKSRFGVVEFARSEPAATAICDLNGRRIQGYVWAIVYFQRRTKRYNGLNQAWRERNIVLSGLPSSTTEGQLAAACEQFGPIESLHVSQKQGNAIGFVCFTTVSAAMAALKGPIRVLGGLVQPARWVQREDRRQDRLEAGREAEIDSEMRSLYIG